jgi:lambda family phage portal protein
MPTGAHKGADTADRALADWTGTGGSADADLLGEMDVLRERGKDIARNSGIAAGILGTYKDNIVGTGPRLSSRANYGRLGRSIEWQKQFAEQVDHGFGEWFDSKDMDVGRRWAGAKQTELVVTSLVTQGETFALLHWDEPTPARKWRTRVQLIESARVSTPKGTRDSETMRGGVELDGRGAPIAVHVQVQHPGAWTVTGTRGTDRWERIPFETDWGRPRVLHIYDAQQIGESRGKSWFTPVLAEFKKLDKYHDAEIKSAIMQAMIALLIETPLDSNAVANMFQAIDVDSYKNMRDLTAGAYKKVKMQGPMVLKANPGDEVKTFAAQRNAQAFDSFVDTFIRMIGVGMNLPYELTFRDFSQTNYSSARAAMLEAWRFFKRIRQLIEVEWLKPLFRCWLEEAVSAGHVTGVTLDEFYAETYAVMRCRWIWPGRGWVDPLKEVQATELKLDNLLTTHEDEAAEQGYTFGELVEQRAREMQQIRDAGLESLYLGSRERALVPSEPDAPVKKEVAA